MIIPVKDRPELLKRAVHSVVSQEADFDFELIVGVDHNDPVKFTQHEHSVSQTASGIQTTIIKTGSKGVAAARNRAAEKARGRYLAFLDSDDFFLTGKLQKQVLFLKKRPHLKASHTKENWIQNGKAAEVPFRLAPSTGQVLRRAIDLCPVSPSTFMIEKELFFQLQGFDETFPVCEDYDFFLRLLSKHPAGLLPEPLTTKTSGNHPRLSSTPGIDLYRIRSLCKNLGLLSKQGERMYAVQSIADRFQILKQAVAYGTDIHLKNAIDRLYEEARRTIPELNRLLSSGQ